VNGNKMAAEASTGLRIPSATYRLQFNGEFGFSAAREIVSYLNDLGITDIYASPFFKAREGSRHGYDIVDQNSLNPEVGTEEEFDAFVDTLKQYGMGQILDIVPNHMCIEGKNSLWMDLLENGPSSLSADFFDIDWLPVKKELENKVLIPILGDQFGTVLENGELALAFEEGAFFVCYYDHKLPIIPKTYSAILTLRIEELERELSDEDLCLQELMSIVTALKHLPPTTERDPERIAERYREKEIVKRRLAVLYGDCPEIRELIDRNVAIFNGTPGEPASFDLLDGLLAQQVYRLSYWRVATEEINYRRFFDINDLGAIRMEDPDVFRTSHRLIFDLVRERKVTGLRVDHADGLYNPSEYFRRLQGGCFLQACLGALARETLAEGAREELETRIWSNYHDILAVNPLFKSFFVIGEKILLKGEKLPDEWPIFSDTGYVFANLVNGLFVDTGNARAFDAIYGRFAKLQMNFPEVVYEKKKLVMQVSMSSEVNTLGHYLNRISEMNRHTRDFTLNSLIKALVEVIAFFPVYRTYITGRDVTDRDRQYVEYAVSKATRKNPALNASIFAFIRDVLLLIYPDSLLDEDRKEWLDFAMRFQQITGPVMAKGAEDTAFYVYNRLVSLNEVGGSPERFGTTLEAFHGQNIERGRSRPQAMLATSTHDTKRSEDVRARINVLSEDPYAWREALRRWSRLNRKSRMIVDGQPVPDRNEEYLLYQTLIGAWPFCAPDDPGFETFRERIKAYMLKAIREAKVNTSWISPDTMYEDAVMFFIDAVLKVSPANRFLPDIIEFQQTTATCGMLNSLAQTLLKITSPGFPDFYQGTELWDLSLVDPDNRRPVDYRIRKGLLDELKRKESAEGLLETARSVVSTRYDGRIKMYLTGKALNFRRENRALFDFGRYLPLTVEGACREHVCAFERSVNDSSMLVVVPRFCSRLIRDSSGLPPGPEVWQDTRVEQPFDAAASRYRNIFTGEILGLLEQDGRLSLAVQDILSVFPVALLERFDRGSGEMA
jgi:(1->4)-alpha-D-glucan 1-alpha-D-glucosylmutase